MGAGSQTFGPSLQEADYNYTQTDVLWDVGPAENSFTQCQSQQFIVKNLVKRSHETTREVVKVKLCCQVPS